MKFKATGIAMPKIWLRPIRYPAIRVAALLIVVTLMQQSAATFCQQITSSEKSISLEKVLEIIKKQSGFLVFYNDQDLKYASKVDIHVKNASVEEALTESFAGQPLNYTIINKTIVVQKKAGNSGLDKATGPLARPQPVKGKVLNENGEPMAGVTVRVKGHSDRLTVTNTGGAYSIVAENTEILVFSFLGYKTRELVVAEQAVLTISLVPSSSDLDQVVVIGYGTTKRKDLTGSVSSVDVKDVKDVPFASLDQALSGKAAGVQVVPSDGSPGGVAKIRIRGGTSILGGSDPLYIIDGVQVTIENRYIQSQSEVVNPISGNDNNNGSVSSSFARGLNSLGGLNVNDIESIDILKDASSTAIYGSKAANGVVIITTKKGKFDQKPLIEFNYYAGTSTPERQKVLNASQYKMIMTEAAQNLTIAQAGSGQPVNAVANGILHTPNFLGTSNTDWLGLVLRNGFDQNADFSVRGGGKGSRYYTSLSYTGQDGVVRGTDFKRVSGKVNLDNTINSKLRTITNINYGFTTTDITNGAYTQALLAPPTMSPYHTDGSVNNFTGDALGSYTSSGIQNPLSLLTNAVNRGKSASLLGSVALEYNILKDLKFRSVASVNYNQYRQTNYTPSTALISTASGAASSGNGIGSEGQTGSTDAFFENTLTYDRQLGTDSHLNIVAGTSWEQAKSNSFLASGQSYPNDVTLTNLSSAAITLPSTASMTQSSLLSFYARANYSYKSRYLFTFTGRSDASSKFPANNRTGYFPSGGIGWRLSQENFLKKVGWIDDLKIRASAGYTGSQNIGDHLFRTLYTPASYNGSNAVLPTQLGNNTIKWESTLQKDAGVDFSFFNSRLIGDIGIYEKNTSSLLFNKMLAPSSSYGSVIANIADIRNRGLEINLRGEVIRNKNFNWNSSLNFSFNRSLVTHINQDFSDPNESGAYLGNTIIREGKPLGLFYGDQFQGIIKTQAQLTAYKARYSLYPYITPYLNIGDPIYQQTPYGYPNSSLVIGNAEPKFYGGYTNIFTYKNLSLTSLFNYSYGGKILYLYGIQNEKVIDLSNKGVSILGRWTPENTGASIPRVIYGQNGNISTASNDIYSSSFIKLKSVTLSCQVPKHMLEKWKVQSASVYISATNLFTITKYPGPDPEVSNNPYSLISGYSDASAYPTVRQYVIGFRIGF